MHVTWVQADKCQDYSLWRSEIPRESYPLTFSFISMAVGAGGICCKNVPSLLIACDTKAAFTLHGSVDPIPNFPSHVAQIGGGYDPRTCSVFIIYLLFDLYLTMIISLRFQISFTGQRQRLQFTEQINNKKLKYLKTIARLFSKWPNNRFKMFHRQIVISISFGVNYSIMELHT